MNNLTRLLPLAVEQEQQSAARTGRAMQHVQRLRNQLRQLRQYQHDYQPNGQKNALLTENNHHFLMRLGASVQETKHRLQQQEAVADREKQRWHTSRAKRKALELLIEKQQATARAARQKRQRIWQTHCRK